ncbi:MAG: type IV secretion system protein [Pseudomonadota bacterium]
MTTTCDLVAQDMGTGVAAALAAVDCIASEVTGEAFGRLFAPGGSLAIILTILLTLYVAFFGISLLLGRSNLSVRALTPRMITIGLVLTFATSWVAYQSVVWNLAIGAPDWLAGVLTDTEGSATATFATKLDIVFLAVQEASTGEVDINAFSPQGMMWLGAMLLLLGTVGLLVTARIALALLVALGPIFVVMGLFNGTRGLFTGWLKGVVMLALTPLFAVLGGSIMLELAVPILAALVAVPGEIDQQAAMAFFLVGAVHVALMFMTLKVASTMVAGWQVFGLVPSKDFDSGVDVARPAPALQAPAPGRAAQAAPAAIAAAGQRRIDVAPAPANVAANDTGLSGSTTTRETKVFATTSGGGQVTPLNPANSRTLGIGNRFRSADARAGTTKSEMKR